MAIITDTFEVMRLKYYQCHAEFCYRMSWEDLDNLHDGAFKILSAILNTQKH